MSPFVEVAAFLPVAGTFTYAVPERFAAGARVGARVLVPFGGRGVTAVIVRETDAPGAFETKPIGDLLDPEPALDPGLVDLCLWVADYYEAPPGEALRAALPAGTQVSATILLAVTELGHAALAGEGKALSRGARRLLEQVAAAPKGILPAAGTPAAPRAELVGAGLLVVGEEREIARIAPKMVTTVELVKQPLTDEQRKKIARAPRKAAVLAVLEAAGRPVERSTMTSGKPGVAEAIRGLVEMGVAVLGEVEANRELDEPLVLGSPPAEPLPPTPDQAAALQAIYTALDAGAFAPFLLHGVTGSGKTEVYLQAIAHVLDKGQGALVLVPEIALTPQLAARFRARFGDRVAVLHSALGEAERYEQWRRLKKGEARIALGARSAVFAPVEKLGIVVVDEEHDPSFKQEEGVRYHGRDVALMRAAKASAVCLLGSATPSLESYAQAQAGKYTLLELAARPTARPMPEVEVVDLRVFKPDGDTFMTAPLVEALSATLAAGEQAILFLNRRGFATFVNCVACGHSFRCPNCSVSLTYHRSNERLRCHYCGHAEHVPIDCPKCGTVGAIERHGLGTEKVESALRERFPAARVARLDRDTAAGKGLGEVLARVQRHEVDLLVGTQMVTKGHDFPGVTLVGVLCADGGLAFPDFRAGERTFQLLTQVAGRAGRGDRPGRVVVQSWAPEHVAVRCARDHDYKAFFREEMAQREELGYPPRGRLTALRFDGLEEHTVRAAADMLGARAVQLSAHPRYAGIQLMGPAEAPLARLKGRTRWHLWVRGADRAVLRQFVRRIAADREGLPVGVRVTIDVDPVSAL